MVESPYPLRQPHFGPGCCSAEIEELLGDCHERLPEYSEYLALCRRVDATDVFNGYFLFSPVHAVQRGEGPRLLHVGSGPDLSEVRVLPIGGDGGGNLFLMGYSPNAAGAVWKWDHEYGARFDGMAKDGITKIADDFAGFLERIAEDWEHFTSGDRAWHYVSG